VSFTGQTADGDFPDNRDRSLRTARRQLSAPQKLCRDQERRAERIDIRAAVIVVVVRSFLPTKQQVLRARADLNGVLNCRRGP